MSFWTSFKANCTGLNLLLIFVPIAFVLRVLDMTPTAQLLPLQKLPMAPAINAMEH